MKRNGFGFTHKVKGSMEMGLVYPVLSQEMIAGDIARIKPEVLIKSVIPPVTQLTDTIKYNVECAFTPYRLLDNHFVANMSTTKTGTVKGDFKSWSLGQIVNRFGSVNDGITPYVGHDSKIAVTSRLWKERNAGNTMLAHYGFPNGNEKYIYTQKATPDYTNDYVYDYPLPAYLKDGSNAPRCAPFFGQGSLMDWLGLEPNGNLGQSSDLSKVKFNTFAISAYYMFINFYKTIPEYEKYIAPHFDYPKATDANAIAEGREKLHRYEILEEEFGNGFEYPSLSGRCVNGLVIDNWCPSCYFCNTLKDPQRGIAPTVPVSITGSGIVNAGARTTATSNATAHINLSGALETEGGSGEYWRFEASNSNFAGSFVISDLRSALALQHFQEDTQTCFKWTDFLQKVYGTSPRDSLIDAPVYVGGFSGVLASNEVLQTAETSQGNLGDIGGKLSGYKSGKMFTFRAKEPGVIQVYVTIKPERNYEAGTERQFTRMNYLDMYFPQFTGIGNQAVRIDEVCAVVGAGDRDKNFGFTSRYEDFKHKYNRVVGKCRNDNMVIPNIIYGSSTSYMTLEYARSQSYPVPYLNDFHPYAIGDAYTYSQGNIQGNSLEFQSNGQDFLLCTPQLNDIFVDDSEEPFLSVIGLNMDMFRPIPVHTKAGISYV